ncbi:hypothetical protein Poli38472_002051 [Pythium oligandrum]|uniref:Fungal lipase-type domain-containing protein n=1 Tax=Pythium oligandrum TaxID=41045 RepID=A0A8K1CI24_PYTOL|nr:hypothetical protein Poli38472_002051 [Pythium oligandrum]|eukprot:TMW63110.1 hypothetical protein Poli38472_002051 [Pythium oligandrum]
MNKPYYHAETAELPDVVDTTVVREETTATVSNGRLGFHDAIRAKDTMMTSNQARGEELDAHHETRATWGFYRTFCQFRFGYLSFLVLMSILVFSFTLLMEVFFAIFLPSAQTFSTEYVVRAVILLALLPVILFLLSYLFEEGARFFWDGINKIDGGLPNFRLALAVVIHYLRHRKAIKEASVRRAAVRESFVSQVPLIETNPTRGSILMSSREDPFIDDDKEEEDRIWEENEQRRQEVDEAAAIAEATRHPASPARNRWKKAGAAVKATLRMAKVEDDGPEIDFTAFLIVDIICPAMFELVTIIVLVLNFLDSWSPTDAFLAYVQVGFWIMAFYLVLWMITHFWTSRNPHMRLIVSHYRRKRRILHREVKAVRREKQSEGLWLMDVGFRFYHHVGVLFNPLACFARKKPEQPVDASGTTTTTAESSQASYGSVQIDMSDTEEAERGNNSKSFRRRMENIREARARLRAKNPWYRLSYNRQALILMFISIAAALVSLASFFVGWPIMGMCMIMLSNVIQRRFPQIFGQTFRHFITAFVVMSLVFFSSTFIIGTFVTGGNFKLGAYVNVTEETLTLSANGNALGGLAAPLSSSVEYPVCSLDYDGLSILDLALIADAAYGSTPEIQNTSLINRFNGTDLQDWEFVDHNEPSEHQVWMEIYFRKINMTVVAVRGTASATDALEDLHFWFGILIMQAVNIFVPFLKQLPREFVVNMVSMQAFSSVMPPPVYEPLVDHVTEVRKRVGENLVMTGHSLGGAMAAMVGAKTKTRAVSFSGPGLLYSRGRFGIEAQDIRNYVITIKPQKDIVPRVDELGGMVQEIRCWEKSPMKCHSTLTHMCELEASCGDKRRRTWETADDCIRYRGLIPNTTTS